MGTNYYVRTDCCKTCKHSKEEIHIGKSSAGWKFAIEIHKKYYEDFNEFKEFTRLNDGSIYDEYGETISFKELMDKIESKREDESHSERKDGTLKTINEEDVDLVFYEFS